MLRKGVGERREGRDALLLRVPCGVLVGWSYEIRLRKGKGGLI